MIVILNGVNGSYITIMMVIDNNNEWQSDVDVGNSGGGESNNGGEDSDIYSDNSYDCWKQTIITVNHIIYYNKFK